MRPLRRLVLLALLPFALTACDAADPEPEIATANSTVTVEYVGRLEDGTIFDQNKRATFSLQGVIPGFREGIVGMRVGDERDLVIPPEKAYGATGIPGVIPPNATLYFYVKLLDIR